MQCTHKTITPNQFNIEHITQSNKGPVAGALDEIGAAEEEEEEERFLRGGEHSAAAAPEPDPNQIAASMQVQFLCFAPPCDPWHQCTVRSCLNYAASSLSISSSSSSFSSLFSISSLRTSFSASS